MFCAGKSTAQMPRVFGDERFETRAADLFAACYWDARQSGVSTIFRVDRELINSVVGK